MLLTMRCPTLAELPPPPSGKTGWPWTEETSQLPDSMPNGIPWPCISIVTPSYNQGQFIEETIRSVLLQGYPDLEYIIIDGGSTDGSVEIIKKYEPWLAYWVSEPDRGQSHAINKGFLRAKGDIVAWLNSDDFYLPSSVMFLVKELAEEPTLGLVYGICESVGLDDNIVFHQAPGKINIFKLLFFCPIGQPSVFLRRTLLDQVGFLDETLSYAMDWELWLRAFAVANTAYVPRIIARAYVHPGSKTVSNRADQFNEYRIILRRYVHEGKIPEQLVKFVPHAIATMYWMEGKYHWQHNRRTKTFLAYCHAWWSAPCYVWRRKVYHRIVKLLPSPIQRLGLSIKQASRHFLRK